MVDQSLKGAMPETHDGSSLRIGIVHARWNRAVIDSLLSGVKDALKNCRVANENIVIQSVPGSWELPGAVSESVPSPLITLSLPSFLHKIFLYCSLALTNKKE